MSLEGREVGANTDTAVNDLVVLDDGAGGFLETDTHAGGARGVGNDVVACCATLCVHEVNADRVVVEAVAFDDVLVGEHEMDRIAAALAKIVAEGIAMGVPGHHVARIDDFVLLDQVVMAVPEAEAVAAYAQFAVLGAHGIAA